MFFAQIKSYRLGDFPVAEKFHETSLKLPVWHNSEDIDILKEYLEAITKVISLSKQLL
jgi:hypothetical protein